MSQPHVTMVCLYADRDHFVTRMLRSFREQTYRNKSLVIYDNGAVPFDSETHELQPDEYLVREATARRRTIGAMRNLMNALAKSDILATLDVDDWSHPNRLTEQVALLESSGADAVGYDEMLFWREREQQAWLYSQHLPGVHAVAVGTSLLYWRRTWQQKPFRDTSSGEDLHFCSGLKVATASSLHADGEPRMIASIHGGNTASVIDPKAREWKRAPEFDDYCARKMSYAREDSNTPIPA